MPTPLFPPDYPHSAARPLEAFGLAFAEEISRSTMAALFPDRDEDLSRTNVQFAAGLTMLEGMHPRDHLECMFAAQGVAFHASAMDCLGQAMFSDTPLANANKLRASAAQMQRAFSKTVRDLKWLQASPLMERPGKATPGKAPPAEATPGEPPDDPPPSGPGGGRKPRSTKARPAKSPAATSTPLAPEASAADFPAPDPELSALAQEAETEEISEEAADAALLKDIETRPDGTPGSLAAYAPTPEPEEYIRQEPSIMWALAQREKPYKQVNVPGQASDNASPPAPGILTQTAHGMDTRLPLDVNEKLLTGDALARFVSARFDPDAPSQAFSFDDEDAMMELELISTGGDPDLEAEKQALMAAHPEGKAIKTIRNGARAPAVIPRDEPPPKKPPDTG